MSCLLVDELLPGRVVTQHFLIHRDTDLKHIRVKIYKNLNTSGNLKLSLYDGDTLLTEFKEITASEINAEMVEDYGYGFIRFDLVDQEFVSLHLKEGESKTEYNWRLESDVGTDIAFIGVIREYENQIYQVRQDGIETYQATNDSIEPYAFEIYEYKYI